jgi:hypothetical protein
MVSLSFFLEKGYGRIWEVTSYNVEKHHAEVSQHGVFAIYFSACAKSCRFTSHRDLDKST